MMNIINNQIKILVVISLFLGLTSCKKLINSDQIPDEENELITTVSIMFIDTLVKDTLNYRWSQPGGPGSAITVDTIKLKVNTKYLAYTSILDESKTPVFNVSEEIKTDANSHRFVYTPSTSRLTTKILDFDTQMPPIELGLYFEANTNNVGEQLGKLNVVLKHYTESSPKTGGLANGSTDIEVDFPLKVN